MKQEIIHTFDFLPEGVCYRKYNTKKKSVILDKTYPGNDLSGFPAHTNQFQDSTWIILPRSLFIEKHISVPSHEENEIWQMVAIQSGKLVPFPAEDILFSYYVLKQTVEGYSELILYILNKKQLAKLIAPLLEKGFYPDELFIRPLLISQFLSHIKVIDEENHIFAYLQPGHVEMGVINKGQLIFSRCIDYTDMETEITQSFEYVQNKYLKDLKKHILFVCDENRKQAPIENASQENYYFSFKDVFTFCMKSHTHSFSLPEVNSMKKVMDFKTTLYRVCVIFILTFSTLFIYTLFQNRELNQELLVINKKIASISSEAERIKLLKEKIDIFNQHFTNSDRYISGILELYRLIPDHVTLTFLHFRDPGKITLKGIAEKGVISVIDELENSTFFQNVSLKYQNIVNKDEGVDFHITCDLE